MTDAFDEAPARTPWLMTLADLALLLVGFFVFLQAGRSVDPAKLAQGFRHGFGVKEAPVAPAPAPMAVAMTRLAGFTPGSAMLPSTDGLAAWASDVARDPRTRLTITGAVDGSAGDVDPMTRSGAILAADRARAVASQLVHQGVAPDRIVIATAVARDRSVTLSLGFAGKIAGGRP